MKKFTSVAIILLLGVSLASAVKAQTITTIAGGGPNGLPANVANVYLPTGVAVDGAGNTFIAANNRVYKVDTSGRETIYAGAGPFPTTGNGDGGPALQAVFGDAANVAADSKGNVFVVDIFNTAIRRIDASSHIITTYADSSDGLVFPESLAFDKKNNLFVADTVGVVWRIDAKTHAVTIFAGLGSPFDPPSADGTPAANANIGGSIGVVVDSHDNVFISDNVYGNLYRFDSSPNHLMKLVLTGIESRDETGLALDSMGNVYIADKDGSVVRRWDASSHTVNTGTIVAGIDDSFDYSGDGGPANHAILNLPTDVAVFGNTLYIADFHNSRIRAVDIHSNNPAQQIISTFAGNGTLGFSGDGYDALQASLFGPNAVTMDLFGNLFIGETDNAVVRRVSASTNTVTTYAGNAFKNGLDPSQLGDGGPATSATLDGPVGLAFDIIGDLYIADSFHSRIRAVDPFFHRINTVAGTGEFGNGCDDTGPATNAALSFPSGVASDLFGNLFVTDQIFDDPCVRRVDAFTRNISKYADFPPISFPFAIARDLAGNLYVTDFGTVRKINTLQQVSIIAGDPDNLCSAPQDGIPATTASFCGVDGVAVDSAGNVYIADTGNNLVREVDANSHLIFTVAGNGVGGYNGDGGPATAAELSMPGGLFLDRSGNLYIADKGNNRIRKVVSPQHH